MKNKRKRKYPNSPPSGEPWIWLLAEMLSHVGWRALSINARRVLERIMIEHMAHAGKENGNLIVTHRQFQEYGVNRNAVADAIAELEYFGWIKVTRKGRGGVGTGHPNHFLLTWMPEKDSHFCDAPWARTTPKRIEDWPKERRRLQRLRNRKAKAVSD
jgi:hypothetical protein